MNIYCVDDNLLQLKRSKLLVETACQKKNITDFEIIECDNGQELLNQVASKKPNMVLLDIHMPILDGLSTLACLRSRDKEVKIIMVSSENSSNVKRFKTVDVKDIDDTKKWELLKKVVDRVKLGVQQEGKINSILEACGSLEMDPVQVAESLGANGYIQKPYESEKASLSLIELL